MFELTQLEKKIESSPWDISFDQRFNGFSEDQRKKVIYVAEKGGPGTFRYRVYNMCQALQGSDDWGGYYFYENEFDRILKFLDSVDVVVLSRLAWSSELSAFIDAIHAKKIPVIFDVDDLVYDIFKIPLLVKTLWHYPGDALIASWNVFKHHVILKKCDFVLTTNSFLAEQVQNYSKKDVFSIPNFLNNEQLESADFLFEQKTLKKPQKPFVIGYFSGSKSHENDFKIVAPHIARLMKRYKDIELKIVGFIKVPAVLQDFADSGRIHHDDFVDFVTLMQKVASVDLNIVPLVENVFTNCKSELKFFEASVVGTPTCATPTHVFDENIEHGKTGFLCRENEWFKYMEKVYLGDYVDSLIGDAREYCLQKYSPAHQRVDIEKVLDIFIAK